MKKLILFATVLYLVAPPVALSAPKAQSAQECAIFADLALTSSAAARHGMERKALEAMLADMYSINDDKRASGVVAAVLDAVFGSARGAEPRVFAAVLGRACMSTEGDMDSVLGTGS